MSLDITPICDFDDKVIMLHHDNVIIVLYPTKQGTNTRQKDSVWYMTVTLSLLSKHAASKHQQTHSGGLHLECVSI